MNDGIGMSGDLTLAESVLRLRLVQLRINELLKARQLKVPVHLALGHEAIAVAVCATATLEDALCLTHRNIHYNLVRAQARAVIDELRLLPTGISGGRMGCMNMAQPAGGVVYTSNVLGNDLCVSAGVALADRALGRSAVTFVVTGDGAMEEGAFFETLVLMASTRASAVVVVENNGWSLATRIEERRCRIDLDRLAHAFGLHYQLLEGNDVDAYALRLAELRTLAAGTHLPVLVEVRVTTLGDRRGPPTPQEPGGKLINYHAGAASAPDLTDWPLIRHDDSDPVFMLGRRLPEAALRTLVTTLSARIEEDLA